jgi:hypothetical protein
VHVQVHDGLARGLADVDADVVAVGPQLAVELPADLGDRGEQRALLARGGVEPRRDVPARQDQRVPRRHRVAVADRDDERVPADEAVGRELAEHAGHGRASIRPRRALRAGTS